MLPLLQKGVQPAGKGSTGWETAVADTQNFSQGCLRPPQQFDHRQLLGNAACCVDLAALSCVVCSCCCSIGTC